MLLLLCLAATALAAKEFSFWLDGNHTVFTTEGKSDKAYVLGQVDDLKDQYGYIHWHAEVLVDTIENLDKAYLIGFSEGYLTATEISYQYENVLQDVFAGHGDEMPKEYLDWCAQQRDYINKQIANAEEAADGSEPWWRGVELVMSQLRGLADGYARYAGENPSHGLPEISYETFYALNSATDFSDGLELALFPEDPEVLERHRLNLRDGLYSHCTGAIRLTPEVDDLYCAHVSWTSWGSGFNKVMKSYVPRYTGLPVEDIEITYSSYAGLLTSMDDFYIKSGINAVTGEDILIWVTETTYNIFNESAPSMVHPESVLTWTRAMVSALIATDGPSYYKWIVHNTSNTYDNNWIVVDYKRFGDLLQETKDLSPEERLQYINENGVELIYTIEMVPGLHDAWDATSNLTEDGFYMSLNTPTKDEIFQAAEYPDDPYYAFYDGARYKLFYRLMPDVKSFEDFKSFLRYNNYENDPESNGDPGESISSRYDLRDETCTRQANSFGAVDAKVTTLEQAKEGAFYVIVGPTLGLNNHLPPVDLTDWPDCHHAGIPDNLPVSNAWNLYKPAVIVRSSDYVAVYVIIGVVLALLVAGLATWLGLKLRAKAKAKKGAVKRSSQEEGSEAGKKDAEEGALITGESSGSAEE